MFNNKPTSAPYKSKGLKTLEHNLAHFLKGVRKSRVNRSSHKPKNKKKFSE